MKQFRAVEVYLSHPGFHLGFFPGALRPYRPEVPRTSAVSSNLSNTLH